MEEGIQEEPAGPACGTKGDKVRAKQGRMFGVVVRVGQGKGEPDAC